MLHTGVLYVCEPPEPISFCSISDCTRHDPAAIWAHLDPVLDMIGSKYPNIDTIYFWSDSPSTQYRQKANFYFMSTEPFQKGFKRVYWNFFEAGHCKGAPGGVGGSLKRSADRLSRQSCDIADALSLYSELAGASNIQLFFVSEEDVDQKSNVLASAGQLKPVKGTMQLHQVICLAPNKLQVREVSCFCSKKDGVLICPCFSPFDACVVQAVRQVNNDKRSSTHPDVMLTHRPWNTLINGVLFSMMGEHIRALSSV